MSYHFYVYQVLVFHHKLPAADEIQYILLLSSILELQTRKKVTNVINNAVNMFLYPLQNRAIVC